MMTEGRDYKNENGTWIRGQLGGRYSTTVNHGHDDDPTKFHSDN